MSDGETYLFSLAIMACIFVPLWIRDRSRVLPKRLNLCAERHFHDILEARAALLYLMGKTHFRCSSHTDAEKILESLDRSAKTVYPTVCATRAILNPRQFTKKYSRKYKKLLKTSPKTWKIWAGPFCEDKLVMAFYEDNKTDDPLENK